MRLPWKSIQILLLVLLFSLSVSSACALTISAPDVVPLGVPFPVRVSGEENLTSVKAVWMGDSIPFEPVEREGQRFWAVDLVCPVTDGQPGRQMVTVEVVSGDRVERLPWQVTVKRRDFPVTRLTVPQEKAVPPAAVRDRIIRERREAERVLARESLPSCWSLPLVRPVAGIVTSPYGAERTFNGQTQSRHSGIDFRAAPGTPVLAIAGGQVVLTGDRYFAGKSVYVDHGGGRVSLYGHLSRIEVHEGQPVKAGDVLGFSGATGRVTGPHLHFGLAFHGSMADGASLFKDDERAFISDCRQVSVSLD